MQNTKTKELCIKAMFCAVIMLATMSFKIPVPATNGYIHLGDSLILIISVFFGVRYAVIPAALGSMLADVLSGYAFWAPYTLVIKGVMAFVCAKIASEQGREKFINPRNILAPVVAVAVMVTGYFFVGVLLKGGFAAAAAGLPGDLIQGFGGMAIYLAVGSVLYTRRKLLRLP
ncbi:MAG: ECF transporter S component [Firmicutes bacterium]|nr:ECF transporter S component [Bacillota bacterium]